MIFKTRFENDYGIRSQIPTHEILKIFFCVHLWDLTLTLENLV